MVTFLFYLLKVSVGLAAFYLLYYLLLRNTTFIKLNRFFLVAGLILSFVLPHIQLTIPKMVSQMQIEQQIDQVINEWPHELEPIVQSTTVTSPISIYTIIIVIYWTGCLFIFCKLLLSIFKILYIKSKAQKDTIGQQSVFIARNQPIFTFLHFIFIPDKNIDPLILAHEKAHVKQLHWVDLLICEITTALLWFNPMIYFYKRSMLVVHEYLADRHIVVHPDLIEKYLNCLYLNLTSKTLKGPIFNFNSKPIMKRINMMTKSQSSKIYYLAYSAALPIVLLLLTSFSVEPIVSFNNETGMQAGAEQVFNLPGNFNDLIMHQKDDIPSINPVDDYKVSSGFGKRKHPISKELLEHTGIDLKSPSGKPVYATANGVVVTSEFFGKRGNLIVIKHGESYSTSYSHLESRAVAVGDKVLKKQVIGKVGNTGESTAPHLHYEVIKNDVAIDPAPYMVKK